MCEEGEEVRLQAVVRVHETNREPKVKKMSKEAEEEEEELWEEEKAEKEEE